MRLRQRLPPPRPALSGAEGGSSHSSRIGAPQGGPHSSYQHLPGKPGSQRINRLHRRQALLLIGVGQHVIGVHHLQPFAERIDHAADETRFSGRQRLHQVLRPGIEEHQDQLAAVVGAEDAVGAAARSRRLVFEDAHAQRRRPARLDAGDRWRKPPIDDCLRQMPEQIDDARPRQLAQRLRHRRSDAGQRVDGREQGKQDGWAHFADETADRRAGGRYMLALPTKETKR